MSLGASILVFWKEDGVAKSKSTLDAVYCASSLLIVTFKNGFQKFQLDLRSFSDEPHLGSPKSATSLFCNMNPAFCFAETDA